MLLVVAVIPLTCWFETMAGPAHPPTEPAHPAAGWRWRLRALVAEMRHMPDWVRRNPLRSALACSSLLLLGVALVMACIYLAPVTARQVTTISQALEALDAGDYPQARELALRVRSNRELLYHEMAGPYYVLGLVLAHDARQHWNRDEQQLLYLVAAKYLQEASDREFPTGREAEGNFQLGRCWRLAGENAKALAPLHKALELDTPQQVEAHRFLAEAYMALDPPQLQKALQHNHDFLAAKRLSPLDRQEGQLRESHIRLALNDLQGCEESLAKIPAATVLAAEVSVLRGRVLLREGDLLRDASPPREAEAQAKYQQALQTLRSTPNRDNLEQGPPPAAQYLLGVALDRLGDKNAAETQFGRIRRIYSTSPEKLPASIREADLLAHREAYAEAVQLARKTLEEAEGLSTNPNPWMTVAEIQRRIGQLHQTLIENEQFDHALELAKGPAGWIPQWQLTLWQAECHEARAATYEQEAARSTLEKRTSLGAKARADRRAAGTEYARLAVLRETTRDYTEDLWRSAQQNFAGQNYTQCAAMVRKYLRNESKNRRPDAILLLGESLLALDEVDSALECLSECFLSFPKHPATYRARVVAAQAYAEKGRLADAKVLLAANVESDELSPRSAEWRDALFLLGKLYYREGLEWEAKSRQTGIDGDDLDVARAALSDLEKSHESLRRAIDNLQRATQRYPDAEQARESQFLLADAYRQAAKWPRKRLRLVAIEAMRAAIARQAQLDLQAAVDHFDELIRQLGEIQESPNHTLLDKRLLRNSYFARADALFDLGRYDDAIKAYSAATNRYQNQPESLEAFVQLAACYRILDKTDEARGTLEQAKIMLSRMKEDADFTEATPYTRDEWNQLLTWLATL
jgi:tetratricopeptide (TPR) repeat protein